MSSLGSGKALCGQAREIIFNVYQYLAKAKIENNLNYNVADSTSEATGVSVRFVYKIVKEGKTLGAACQQISTPSNKNKDRKNNRGFDAMEGIKVEAMDFITGEVFLDDHNIDLSPTHSGIKIEAVDLKNEEIFLDDHDMNLSPSDCGVKDDGFVEKSEDSSIDSNDSNILPSCSAIAPRRKPDAKKRKQWDPEKMKAAVAAVRGKEMGYLMASKEFGVPRSSLFRLVNNKVEDVTQAVSTTLGRKPVFPKELEDELVKYLIEMESMPYERIKNSVCALAYKLATQNNVPHPFKKGESAGKAWFYAFLNRNKEKLSHRKPSGTSS